MTLNLTVTRYAGRAPVWPPAATFTQRGGTIGRRSSCDWVLADPDGHISKEHCRIDFVGGRYRVTDTSTNGVFLNNRTVPIGFSASAELHDGDFLVIGDYDIAVSVAVAEAAPQPRSRLPDPILLIEAVLRGGDLPVEILEQTDAEAMMHAAGARLRQLVVGLRRLISQRDIASTDDPFRRDDDDEQALLALLVRGQGESRGVGSAIRRCFAAMKAQEEVQADAARAAAVETLAPFLPEALKARIETRTLLAAATKAKYWDLLEIEFKKLHGSEPQTGLAKALVALGEAYDEQDRQEPRLVERRRPAPRE